MSQSFHLQAQMVGPGAIAQVSKVFESPVKVVELQTLPAFEVCEVRIGKTVLKTKGEWEGRLVEEKVELVAVVKNITEETETLQGVWFLDVLAVSQAAPVTQDVLVVSPTAGGAEGGASPTAGGPAEGVHPPVILGNVMNVPPELAAQAAEAAQVKLPLPEPIGAYAPVHPVQVGPPRAGNVPGAVVPGMNEIAICLTYEQLRRILFALRGGVWNHLEGPGILRPLEDALRSIGG